MRRLQPVAVTGMGALSAAGIGVDAGLDDLFRGARHPVIPPWGRGADGPVHPVFPVADRFWHPGMFRTAPGSRTVRLALTATLEALKQAGLERERLSGKRVGICIGTNVAGAVGNQDLGQDLGQDPGAGDRTACALPPTAAERYAASSPALGIAREFGLSGPMQTVVTACSAGGDAIGLGAAWIRTGLCDLVIAGGADELYEITYNGFISLMNSDDAPCKPFDRHRRGLNLGEGAAMMILESRGALAMRGGKPRGYLLGYGVASDAFHLTTPHPEGRGLRLAVAEALGAAGLTPGEIAFINAHGTGTPDNDRIESQLFHDTFPGVPFLSTKGYTGHTLGAAGALEALFTLGCLSRGMIPPSGGFVTPDPDLPAAPVRHTTPVSGRAALSQTLAFGGNNAVLIFGTPETGP